MNTFLIVIITGVIPVIIMRLLNIYPFGHISNDVDTIEEDFKYVVLEHKTLPNRGFRFWTSNEGEINTEWYTIVEYTNSEDVAIALSKKANYSVVPSISELEDYWREKIKK